ncbi:MAG: hypothetical protein K8R99_14835 [Actinomycetia bacterium]|nr:hypothetical protein [Actinomycetes bacterium]
MTDIFKDKGLGEDPGWGRENSDPLVVLRYLFISFCLAVLGMGVVVVFLGDTSEGSAPRWLSLVATVAVGCMSLVAQALIPRPLDCASLKSLAMSYRARFFLRLAMSEVVGLAAFAMGIALGPWWVYYLGAAFTLAGFARLAPTARHIQQDQDRLSLNGCQLSLTEALRTAG